MTSAVRIIIACLDADPPASLYKLREVLPFNTELDLLSFPLLKDSLNKRSGKWHAEKLLSCLASELKRFKHRKCWKTDVHLSKALGITDVDLYFRKPSPLFGISEVGKDAVISMYRLRSKLYGDERDEELFQERVLKIAMHELGHAFGVGHCRTKRCVMSHTHSIERIDEQFSEFCNNCKQKLLEMVENKRIKNVEKDK